MLRNIGTTQTNSQGDVMWAMKSAPKEGSLPVTIARASGPMELSIELLRGWNKPDLSWRRSISKLKK
jgi:hypothetical protein